jgi:uncharacterized protein YbjT (DUF2867 family)
MNKILVLGASGTVGRLLVPALVAKGQRVRAASRSGRSFDGAEAVRFDFADASTHAAAFEGIDRLYLLSPADNLEVEAFLLPVIALAAERGVKVVMQSVMGVEHEPQDPYRKVEIALESAPTSWVILRPNWFADNFHGAWAPAVARGEIALPAGDGASSFIDARDIAACAAAALTTDRFDHQAFTLTGPQALGYRDAAVLLSRAAGRTITYTPIGDDAFVAAMQSAGLPEAYGRMLAELFSAVREGRTAAVSDGVEVMTGRLPRELAQYAADQCTRVL